MFIDPIRFLEKRKRKRKIDYKCNQFVDFWAVQWQWRWSINSILSVNIDFRFNKNQKREEVSNESNVQMKQAKTKS